MTSKLQLMQLVTYLNEGHDQLAMVVNGNMYPMDSLHSDLPISMAMFLNYWDDVMQPFGRIQVSVQQHRQLTMALI